MDGNRRGRAGKQGYGDGIELWESFYSELSKGVN